MKTTLNLNDDVLRQAKARAARDGVTLTRFIEDAVAARLLEHRKRSSYRFRPTIVHGSAPPAVDPADRDALYEFMDGR